MAIETAIQNGGIGVVVINLTFPSPYSDMALLPILAFFFCSAGPFLALMFAIKEAFNKLRERMSNKVEDLTKDDEEKRAVSSPHVVKSHRVIDEPHESERLKL